MSNRQGSTVTGETLPQEISDFEKGGIMGLKFTRNATGEAVLGECEWLHFLPGGEGGIRTHGGPKDHNGFRDRPIRPLWHLSGADYSIGKCALSLSLTGDWVVRNQFGPVMHPLSPQTKGNSFLCRETCTRLTNLCWIGTPSF
jgi:hypothetical protein